MNGNSSAFNTQNPFDSENPGYYSEIFNGNVSGPMGKNASSSSPCSNEISTISASS